MSITIDLPPAVVQEATAFAASRNITLEQLFVDSLDAEINRKREASRVMSRLEALVKKTGARLTGEPYKFNRADAYEPETPYA
jgi:hypothetical protein